MVASRLDHPRRKRSPPRMSTRDGFAPGATDTTRPRLGLGERSGALPRPRRSGPGPPAIASSPARDAAGHHCEPDGKAARTRRSPVTRCEPSAGCAPHQAPGALRRSPGRGAATASPPTGRRTAGRRCCPEGPASGEVSESALDRSGDDDVVNRPADGQHESDDHPARGSRLRLRPISGQVAVDRPGRLRPRGWLLRTGLRVGRRRGWRRGRPSPPVGRREQRPAQFGGSGRSRRRGVGGTPGLRNGWTREVAHHSPLFASAPCQWFARSDLRVSCMVVSSVGIRPTEAPDPLSMQSDYHPFRHRTGMGTVPIPVHLRPQPPPEGGLPVRPIDTEPEWGRFPFRFTSDLSHPRREGSRSVPSTPNRNGNRPQFRFTSDLSHPRREGSRARSANAPPSSYS